MSYSAVATKVRAMEKRLLRDEDYEKLAGMENFSQAAEYLCKIPAYSAVFEGKESASIRRSDMEQLLVGTLYFDFRKLYRFCNRQQRELLKLYFRKYEIAEIKHALRHVLKHGDSTEAPVVFRESMQRFTRIHLEELADAQTGHEVALALRDTDYKEVLEKTGVLEKESLLDCEMVLDLFYFTEFWKLKDKVLKKKECRLLTESFGSRIDLLNLTWIYRAKKYYKVSDASVYALLIPVCYKLRDREIRELVTAPDMESLEKVIRRSYYGSKFEGMEMSGLERFYHDFLKKIYARERRDFPYSIVVLTSYLYRKEEEIRKLTTVLEGIWYGLPKEETLAYIQ